MHYLLRQKHNVFTWAGSDGSRPFEAPRKWFSDEALAVDYDCGVCDAATRIGHNIYGNDGGAQRDAPLSLAL
jgi:hypothetical protein